MATKLSKKPGVGFWCVYVALLASVPIPILAQLRSTGQITGTVQDQSGAVVPGAQVRLEDQATRLVQTTVSSSDGAFVFPSLQVGAYQLTVTAAGFQTGVYTGIAVDAGRTSNVTVDLKLGETTQQVEVRGMGVLLEPTSNQLSTTVTTQQIEKLPLAGRSSLPFALLMAGAQQGVNNGQDSTFNGLPGAAINTTTDGINNSSQKFKSAGTSFWTFVQPRLGAVEEVTVSTAGLGADAGGQGGMQIRFITKRGTNDFHGSLFWQHINSALNANTWFNDANRLAIPKLLENDFGGGVGGPFWKNKLFFFVNYEETRQPNAIPKENLVLSPQAQGGVFSYVGTDGVSRSVNLLQLAGAAGFPGTVDPTIAGQLQQINSALSRGAVSSFDTYRNRFRFNATQLITQHWPTARLDYHITEKLRWTGSWNLWWRALDPDIGLNVSLSYPGLPADHGFKSTYYMYSTGLDWTITSKTTNEFRIGRQSNIEAYRLGAAPFDNQRRLLWPLGLQSPDMRAGTSAVRLQPLFRNNPVFNVFDNVYHQQGSHAIMMGASLQRNTFWDRNFDTALGGAGVPVYSFGIVGGDPVSSVISPANLPAISTTSLSDAQSLYALLTGRISSITGGRNVNAQTKQFQDLTPAFRREAQSFFGIFVQDSWRATPNLTFNYGLRWEFQGDDENTNGIYTSPPLQDLWGPSGVGNLFAPASLKGVADPSIQLRPKAYNRDFLNPAPNFGFAWSPKFENGFLKSIFGGGGKTVFRGGYSVNYYSEGMLAFGNLAGANPGLIQNISLSPGDAGFAPGGLSLGSPLPQLRIFPQSFAFPLPLSSFTFSNTSIGSIDPSLRAPYIQSWSVGIQREVSRNTVFEARYVGNHGVHLWHAYDINEVNIFENGFLQEFQRAQKNLAVNQAAGMSSFANQGLPGQAALPIFSTAFGALGSQPALTSAQGFGNSTFINYLTSGQAGALASSLASSPVFLCRMVGSQFSPCATRGYNAPGAYPINFFQVNPFAAGGVLQLLTDRSWSNYNGLQVELRGRPAPGVNLVANYTFSKSLTDRYNKDAGTFSNYKTLRNLALDRSPSPWDLRHVFLLYGTFELPFGNAHRLAGNNPVLDRIVGGWTFGWIARAQSGLPFRLGSGRNTVNGQDSGVVPVGLTTSQLQDMVGAYRVGSPYVYFIDPKLIGSDGRANPNLLAPPTTPGQFGSFTFLHSPKVVTADLSLAKRVRIRERIALEIYAEFLNAFNHPVFLASGIGGYATPDINIQTTNFGQTTGTAVNPRNIQFRGQLRF